MTAIDLGARPHKGFDELEPGERPYSTKVFDALDAVITRATEREAHGENSVQAKHQADEDFPQLRLPVVPSIPTEKITVVELTAQDLTENSGILDEKKDREFTNYEAIQVLYGAMGYRVFPGDAASDEARVHNTELHQSVLPSSVKASEFMVGVYAERPLDPALQQPLDPFANEHHGYI